jgi:hypothetical protein
LERKVYFILFTIMLLCVACQWRLTPNGSTSKECAHKVIMRYDQVEGSYLTTGDFSSLQRMSTVYPNETRTLIENVLKLGAVNDPEINNKLLGYFQDSTLQQVIVDVQKQYSNMDDIDKLLKLGFHHLKKHIPGLVIPKVYTQIGALDQSVIVGDNMLGISLDKYLGSEYPLYIKFYNKEQRRMMTRAFIVPDCIGFYLLSLYPMPTDHNLPKSEMEMHMGKIQWVVDKILKKNFFSNLPTVLLVDNYMNVNSHITYERLLQDDKIDKLLCAQLDKKR